MMVLTPLCVFLLNIIVWSIGTKVTKYCKSGEVSSKMNTARLVNRISIVTGMWLYLIYPSICEVLLQSVNCFPSLEQEGPFDIPVSRLRVYPSIVCTDEDYVFYTYAFYVFIFIYVIFIPLLALYIMCKNDGVIY